MLGKLNIQPLMDTERHQHCSCVCGVTNPDGAKEAGVPAAAGGRYGAAGMKAMTVGTHGEPQGHGQAPFLQTGHC